MSSRRFRIGTFSLRPAPGNQQPRRRGCHDQTTDQVLAVGISDQLDDPMLGAGTVESPRSRSAANDCHYRVVQHGAALTRVSLRDSFMPSRRQPAGNSF
jgi:hypothetical protein